jgi:hypothetical protein
VSVAAVVLTTLRLAVPLYLSTLLLGLVPTIVATVGLVSLAGDRPWRADLLSAGWMNVAAEMVMSAVYSRQSPEVALLFIAGLVVLPLALLGQVAVYSFLAGGILESLQTGAGERPRFWTACRRWFWPFLRLSLLGGILVVFAGVLGAAVSGLARPVIGPDISALLQYALQAIVLGWLELSRALMVMEPVRSVGSAMRRASRAVVRPLVLLVWLLIALPGAGLMIVALMPPAAEDPYALSELIQSLAFGQIVAFIGAWTKVVRLAVAVRIAVTTGLTSPPAPLLRSPARRTLLPLSAPERGLGGEVVSSGLGGEVRLPAEGAGMLGGFQRLDVVGDRPAVMADEVRSKLGERLQDEQALPHMAVRDLQAGLVESRGAVQEDVDVDLARAPALA